MAILAVLAAGAAATGPGDTPLAAAREHLRVTAGAEARVREAYEQRRVAGTLSNVERAEYQAYLERISRLVAGYREEIARLTGKLFQTPAPARIDIGAERTDAEGTAALDAELDASLGDFDEMLLREQEELAARTRAASGGDGGGGASAAEYGDAGASAAEAEARTRGGVARGAIAPVRGRDVSSADAPAQGQVVDAGGRAPRGGGKAPLPEDVPDGSDDDIVARQLREAAENETDPELREKLWAEYRKYKDATR